MIRLHKAGLAMVIAPVALVAAWSADAQLASSTKGPIGISADHTEFQANQCHSRWSGAAEAVQDDARLRANSIDTYSKIKSGGQPGAGGAVCGSPERYEADGDVYYVTPTEVVRGDHAVFSVDDKTILVTGQVVVARGKDVMAGTRLLIHTDTREADMESGVTGAGKAGRVQAVLFPGNAQGGGGGLQPPRPPPPRPHGA